MNLEKAKLIYNVNVNLERLELFNESPMQKIIQDYAKTLQDKKEDIIKEALKIHVNEPIDLMTEIKRMFPRIKCILTPENSELFYWDNGTDEGQLLVTFYQGDIFKGMSEEKDGCFIFNLGINYVITPKN